MTDPLYRVQYDGPGDFLMLRTIRLEKGFERIVRLDDEMVRCLRAMVNQSDHKLLIEPINYEIHRAINHEEEDSPETVFTGPGDPDDPDEMGG